MIQKLGPLYLPSIVFGLVYFTVPYQHFLPELASTIIQSPFWQSPFWVLAIVGLISAAFNRGKILQMILLVSLAIFYEHYILNGSIANNVLFSFGVVALIPINFAFISVLREPGVLTKLGVLRLLIIAGQVIAIYYLAESQLNFDWLNSPLFEAGMLSPESHIGFILSVCSLLVVTVFTFLASSPTSNSIFSATVGYCLILWMDMPVHAEGTFTIAIALLLAKGLLRDYHNMAYKDELTNLPQRRALKEQLLSLGRVYSLAMLDVDHFKKFNDTHGHDVGDQVLKMVAAQINKVGGGGKAFRYGGEEFTVVFSGLDEGIAAVHLENIRKTIEDYAMVIRKNGRPEKYAVKCEDSRTPGSFRWAERTVSVTISMGVAARGPREQPDDVMRRADEALYEAKNAGRNCVVTADSTKTQSQQRLAG